MTRSERILVRGSGVIMEISWLAAFTAFSLLSLGGVSIPVHYMTGFFIFGALTSRLMRGKGLRVATVGAVRIAGMAVCLAITIHFLSTSQRAVFDHLWISEFLYTPHSAMEWLCLLIAAFWTFSAWLGGAFFALRPATHEKVSLSLIHI